MRMMPTATRAVVLCAAALLPIACAHRAGTPPEYRAFARAEAAAVHAVLHEGWLQEGDQVLVRLADAALADTVLVAELEGLGWPAAGSGGSATYGRTSGGGIQYVADVVAAEASSDDQAFTVTVHCGPRCGGEYAVRVHKDGAAFRATDVRERARF